MRITVASLVPVLAAKAAAEANSTSSRLSRNMAATLASEAVRNGSLASTRSSKVVAASVKPASDRIQASAIAFMSYPLHRRS